MEASLTKVVVYHCRNLRLFKDSEQRVFIRSHPGLKMVSIPCSGKIEAHSLLQTLAAGADGVLVLACREDACHYLEGSMRSHKRLEYAQYWLRKVGTEPGRLDFLHVPPMDTRALERIIAEFRVNLESFGKIPADGLLKQANAL